ncbi:TIGR04076 family protein [Pelosinus propionicus]|uniref:TIGR04076 family protein n=1 Tax=Pelosinus propionicus DSM 13327 TaxID=1123291 RepID=A0A1I4PNJ0_9FIRM|nr:TIGR04076 family protein [Pelosinus propionicus]SFM29244.1 TIGR04076 family protein [Pelosinus propionicus DSM 13327]
MNKCKIEVIKTTFDEDLVRAYGCKGLGKSPMHKVGDIYYGDYAKPKDLCDEAWKAMYQYVFALAHGSDIFYYGDWIDKPGMAICSCNDGLRPVIFKITATDQVSRIDDL